MKKPKAQREKFPAKKHCVITTDSEGGLPLPAELAPEVKIGDEYAAWKEGDDIIVVFTKNYHGRRKIPQHAHRGKVEPALPEITIRLPMLTKKRRREAKAALRLR